jgi:hypothetical protein
LIFIAHELGHAVQNQSGYMKQISRISAEFGASTLASAWYRISYPEQQRARILDVVNWFGLGEDQAPNTDGLAPAEWFERNYLRLQRGTVQDATAYAWFQQEIFKEVYLREIDADFCEIVRTYYGLGGRD